jgi:hypothetical protein
MAAAGNLDVACNYILRGAGTDGARTIGTIAWHCQVGLTRPILEFCAAGKSLALPDLPSNNCIPPPSSNQYLQWGVP